MRYLLVLSLILLTACNSSSDSGGSNPDSDRPSDTTDANKISSGVHVRVKHDNTNAQASLSFDFIVDAEVLPDIDTLERIEIKSGSDVLINVLNRSEGKLYTPSSEEWWFGTSISDAKVEFLDTSNLSLEYESLGGEVRTINVLFTWTSIDKQLNPSLIYSDFYEGDTVNIVDGTKALAIPTSVDFSIDGVNRNLQLSFSLNEARASLVDIYFYKDEGGTLPTRVFPDSRWAEDINIDGTLNQIVYQESDVAFDSSHDFDDITHVKVHVYDIPSNGHIKFSDYFQMSSYSDYVEVSP
ncbi:hypothetical protein [Reinekea blandensis]|uniref:Uncharacterized protein n=1 Tax=Reinekea blandensis MED297 TaxID=314283 RepID=A4BJL8_9GAMM|nr:hypothetical protein [Reinekea blandensis]EAR07658.1 hypothetical protein MED297_06449 [Reinekea sp. MED297] [Reinekea blandensis MED297]